MKKIYLLFLFAVLALSSQLRILESLRVLSPICNNHGYLWKNQCFCILQYTGPECEQKKGAEKSDDLSDKCDDLIVRLENLDNISPDFYLFDDDEFPRITGNAIDGSNTTGSWIRMHDISKNFHIFSEETSALDIGQGGLGDCYLLAAFASLANRKNGSVLKNMFVDINDNPKHVYVTRWLINGKPRFVAVDDWVPGSSTWTSFTHIGSDKDFWPLILEKSYAKIHGSYKIIEGGWQTAVWSGISLARTFNKWHSSINATGLFDFLVELFKKDYVVGAATISNVAKNEVGGHAYAVLGAYIVELDDNSTVKLVRYFNPWRSEVWQTNPWGDNSKNWTEKVKRQVPYLQGNDGIVFSTIEDYAQNFGVTNWAEIHDNYDINFIDIAFNYIDFNYHPFEVNFTYYGDDGNDLYIFNDQSGGRLLLGCSSPVSTSKFIVVDPQGKTFNADGETVKITNATKGLYIARLQIKRNQKYVKSFTLTSYSQDGKVNFIPLAQNTIIDIQKKKCPNNCNLQGRCNTFDGTCTCYFGYEGIDCGNIIQKSCVNCSGKCDTIFGTCLQPGLFNLGVNKFLNKGNGFDIEVGSYEPWEYVSNGLNGTLHNLKTNNYIDIAGGNLNKKQIILYGLNIPLSANQLWILTFINKGVFIITTTANKNLALVPNTLNNRLTLVNFNLSDINQHWTWRADSVSCPNECSENGICSYITGKCVCKTGFVGEACNIKEKPLQCPNNCSNHGVCDTKTGYCNCQKEFIGEGCNHLYQDFVCPQNCSSNGICSLEQGKCLCSDLFSGIACEVFTGKIMSSLLNLNNGKYLTVDSSRNIIFSNNSDYKWNLTSQGQIIYPANGNALDISGGSYRQGNSIILWGVHGGDNQKWIYEKKDDYFIIRSAGNSEFVISHNSNGKSIALASYSPFDTKQRWRLNY